LRSSQWSNGAELVASDFEHSWKRQLDPSFHAPLANLLYVIENAQGAKEGRISVEDVGVRALDAHTLQVRLKKPTPYFEELLTSPTFAAVYHPSDDEASSQPGSPPIGNGPFVLNRLRPDYEITFAPNPCYWNTEALPYNQSLLRFVRLDDNTALQMFERGELSWAGSPLGEIPTEAIDYLTRSGSIEQTPIAATEFIRLNTRSPALGTAPIRRALAAAVHSADLARYVVGGGALEAQTLSPPSVLQAREAKLPHLSGHCPRDTQPFSLQLSYSTTGRSHQVAQMLQQWWAEELGIQVLLDRCDPKTLFQRRRSGDFEMMLGNWFADFSDALNFLQLFSDREHCGNGTGWESALYSLLVERGSTSTDPDLRQQDFLEAEKILANDVPIIPLFHYSLNYVKDPELEGVLLTPTGQMDFHHAHLCDRTIHPQPQTHKPFLSPACAIQEELRGR
jgi:oligopeptide transport system substrate-binding protein